MSIPLALNSCTISFNLETLPPPFSFTPPIVGLGVAKSDFPSSSPCSTGVASVSSPSTWTLIATFSQAKGGPPFAFRSSIIIVPFLQTVGVFSSIFRFSGLDIVRQWADDGGGAAHSSEAVAALLCNGRIRQGCYLWWLVDHINEQPKARMAIYLSSTAGLFLFCRFNCHEVDDGCL
nr:hypothetical protein Iba_chr11aCG17760 [Ipomoea batatas]